MTVLKDKMLVRFEFSEDGQEISQYTEFFNNEWGRLRDICVSPNGKIYLATNGYSWPSQGPNEIIELYNPDFDYTVNLIDHNIDSQLLYSFDYLGRKVEKNKAGFIINVYDNGRVEKAYVVK